MLVSASPESELYVRLLSFWSLRLSASMFASYSKKLPASKRNLDQASQQPVASQGQSRHLRSSSSSVHAVVAVACMQSELCLSVLVTTVLMTQWHPLQAFAKPAKAHFLSASLSSTSAQGAPPLGATCPRAQVCAVSACACAQTKLASSPPFSPERPGAPYPAEGRGWLLQGFSHHGGARTIPSTVHGTIPRTETRGLGLLRAPSVSSLAGIMPSCARDFLPAA